MLLFDSNGGIVPESLLLDRKNLPDTKIAKRVPTVTSQTELSMTGLRSASTCVRA